MTDREDGADRDGPSDDAADDDPFEYPAAERSGTDSTRDSSPDAEPAADAADAADDRAAPPTDSSRTDAARRDGPRSDANPVGHPDRSPRGVGGWLRWFWTTDSGAAVYVRDVLTSVAAVLLVGLVLFAISGIWPPMVAVESPSMEPNMNTGDLVFVVDNGRFVPDAAVSHDGRTTGVVPADRAAEVGYTEFDRPGDVIIFMPDGNDRRTPVIHRAMLFVEEGEDWYERAERLDAEAVGTAESCDELNNCPAPHAGFVTKGDNNARYDQQTTLSAPVSPRWIIGTAELKVPYLGYVRLAFSGQVAPPVDQVAGSGADHGRSTASTAPTTPSPGLPSTPAAPAGGSGRPVA